jgi:glycosyltransferase involved in cell wall biosynthesis
MLARVTLTPRSVTPRSEPGPIGLVHDYLLLLRGAERTFLEMASCWPEAPVYTLLYDEPGTQQAFAGRVRGTSYLQRLPVSQRSFRTLLPMFPRAAEHLPLGDHQVIVSSSSAFAHGVRPGAEAIHVNYCHTPFRYVWHERERALKEFPGLLRPTGKKLLGRIRAWDRRAAQRVDHFIANSQLTRQRIGEFWNRDAVVVHPPVNTDRFRIGVAEDFFLVVGELTPHKCVDVALEAARRAGQPVKVVGEGPSLESLRIRYGEQAEFLGRVGDAQLSELMSRARALIVANVEEFGIAAVEAQAAGRPVLAPDVGGTRETVIDGVTGVFYPASNGDALTEAMRHVDFDRFDPQIIRDHALGFRPELFRSRLIAEVDRVSGLAVAFEPPGLASEPSAEPEAATAV